MTGREVRVTVPGHFQRGGGPCPYDRLLATRFGTAAVRLIEEGNFGNMVALQNGNIVAVPLSEVAGKLKYVPKDSNIIQSARDVVFALRLILLLQRVHKRHAITHFQAKMNQYRD